MEVVQRITTEEDAKDIFPSQRRMNQSTNQGQSNNDIIEKAIHYISNAQTHSKRAVMTDLHVHTQ